MSSKSTSSSRATSSRSSPRIIVSRATSPRSSPRATSPRSPPRAMSPRSSPRAILTSKELEERSLSRSRTQSRSSQKDYIQNKINKINRFKYDNNKDPIKKNNNNTRYHDFIKLKNDIKKYKIRTLEKFDKKFKSKISKLERQLREYKLHNKRIWDNLKLIRKNLDSKEVFFKISLLNRYIYELDLMFNEVLSI